MSIQISHTLGFAAVLASFGLLATACGDTQPSEQASTVENQSSGGTASVTSSSPEKTDPRATGGSVGASSARATGGSGNDETSSTASQTGGASSTSRSSAGGRTGSINSDQGGTASSATGGSTSRTWRRQTGGASGVSSPATSSAGTGARTSATSAIANTGGNSSSSAATGGTTSVGTGTTEKFSFFVTSYAAIKALSGSENGFGGDLRYGQADGLAGADKICTEVAERSMPKNGKTWRAFLSTSKVNAIDRVGEGPWYDRRGRTFALSKADLLYTRPKGADSAIINDFPNEDGVTNHAPDGTQVDNHDMITGSNNQGKLYSATAACSDWTSSVADNTKKPRVGHSWPRGGRGGTTSTGNVEGMENWMSALDESGCGAGVNIVETGGPGRDGNIGSGGGYGGFYCFALTP